MIDVLAWLVETARRRSTEVHDVPGGIVVRNRDYPGAYDHNRLIINAPVDPDTLAAAAEQALADAQHRMIHVHDPRVAETVSVGLVERGYERGDDVVMLRDRRAPSPATDVRVVELELPERITAGARDWEHDEKDAAVADQLGERIRTVLSAADTTFLAVRGEDGAVVAHVDLFVRDGIAQIEELFTNEDVRGRGYASALVLDAVRRSGANRTFIMADAYDWPQHLYQRLGCTERARIATFSRT